MVNQTVALIIRKICQLWWFSWLNYGTEILLRARVKITPRERRRHAAGERKMRDYRQSPSFWPFTADRFWSVKFVFPSKSIKNIQWDSSPHWAVIALVIGGYLLQVKENPGHVHTYPEFFFPQIVFADAKIFASTRCVFEWFSAVHTYPIVSGNFLICSSTQFFCRRESWNEHAHNCDLGAISFTP